MALGQTAGCPRVNRAKKFMCSPRNTGNINSSLWLTGGLSQGCPDFQKVYVFKVYVPFYCPIKIVVVMGSISCVDVNRRCSHGKVEASHNAHHNLQADGQTGGRTDERTNGRTETETETETDRERQRDRKTDCHRKTDRRTDRQTDIFTNCRLVCHNEMYFIKNQCLLVMFTSASSQRQFPANQSSKTGETFPV